MDEIPAYYTEKIVLSREEERELLIAAKSGNKEARDKIVMANLSLVVYLARQRKQHRDLDILNYGILGILVSIDKFNLSMENRFATFAIHWINQKIIEGMQLKGSLSRMTHKARQVAIEHNLMFPIDVGEEKFYNLRPKIPHVEKDLIKIQMKETVRKVVSNLKDREATILVQHIMEESCTLNDLGDIYGITRERVRQIEAAVLKKLNFRLRTYQELANPDDDE